jgi:hypothetical protein
MDKFIKFAVFILSSLAEGIKKRLEDKENDLNDSIVKTKNEATDAETKQIIDEISLGVTDDRASELLNKDL